MTSQNDSNAYAKILQDTRRRKIENMKKIISYFWFLCGGIIGGILIFWLTKDSLLPFFVSWKNVLTQSNSGLLPYSLSTIFVLAFSVAMVRYLSMSTRPKKIERDFLNEIRYKIRDLERRRPAVITNESKEALIAELSKRTLSETSEKIIEDIRKQISKKASEAEVFDRAETTLDRTTEEIASLRKRSVVNLVLGMALAISGILLLSVFAYSSSQNPSHSSIDEFLITFLPRASIVVLIEIFSYFFLRLYKSGLSEIKYFQNEATNIEQKNVALFVAFHRKSDAFIEEITRHFASTERNPILQNGHTTKELESEKIEHNTKLLADKIIEALKCCGLGGQSK